MVLVMALVGKGQELWVNRSGIADRSTFLEHGVISEDNSRRRTAYPQGSGSGA